MVFWSRDTHPHTHIHTPVCCGSVSTNWAINKQTILLCGHQPKSRGPPTGLGVVQCRQMLCRWPCVHYVCTAVGRSVCRRLLWLSVGAGVIADSQNCCYYTVLCFTAKLCLSFRAGCRTRQDAFAISLGKINEHKSKQRLPMGKCGRVWDCAEGSGIVRSAQNGSWP